jgi:hypothetical protein
MLGLHSKNRFLMKKYIQCILSVWLLAGFTFFVSGKAFSQTSHEAIKTEAAEGVTTVNDNGSTYVKGITSGRARSLVGGVLGLISLIIGWRARVRPSHTGAKLAITLGLIAIVLSIVHLSTVAGAVFGSGSGKAGAIVALPLAISGVILGGLTLRSPRTN